VIAYPGREVEHSSPCTAEVKSSRVMVLSPYMRAWRGHGNIYFILRYN